MEPIIGHRRRKSSIMNPIAGPPAGASAPLRNPQSQSTSLAEDPKLYGEPSDMEDNISPRARDSFSDDDLQDDEETGLTDKEKRRRRKKRRRNTRLDQRVARDKSTAPEDQNTDVDKDVVRRLATNGLLILLWYLFSLSISLYNKWMFDKNELNFAFPLFTTAMHMLVQFGLAALVLYFIPSLRPQYSYGSDLGRSRHEDEPVPTGMSKMFYFTRIGPCGAATGLDIGLGNTSLKFVSLTFYTMCKSSSLAFVLLFAFVFRLETPTWRLIAIIATMTVGVILMVFGEVEFKLGGFVLVISAAFFSGFRWGLTQILLLRNPATSNPFSSIFYLTPIMFATLLALAIPVEGFGPLFEGLQALTKEWGVVMTPLFLLFPGCIAFLMTASEFALLQRTSVVTLSIAGIFKEVVTISAASLVFHDTLTPINFVGLITTLAAILAYNYIKISKMREDAQTKDHHERIPSGPSSPSRSSVSDLEEEPTGETSGLLRQSTDLPGTVVTSDGDLHANLFSQPRHQEAR
ncbi:triose-phosphate transporter family-domain-containing protein [Stachybotrys elegans]|uniref:Triose-phosphate transporter family-domain-containing protein n=1 Tax=Stachybotrys elegans TaxID=80388 RepID=A0A8K0WVG7_9HYPO|nr:triose-phosphate transporter family-domain-containing protein [Stachybotrys elegans]